MADRTENGRSPARVSAFPFSGESDFLAAALKVQEEALDRLPAEHRESWLCLLEGDSRKGRRDLARRLRARECRRQTREARWLQLSSFDSEMAAGGILAGVDEVGRGPLAGPVTAAAVVLPPGYHAPGLDDSKKMTATAREKWAANLRRDALAWAVVDVAASEIDRLGIRPAVFAAMRGAVEALNLKPDLVLVDGREVPPHIHRARALIGGDARSLSIAAASVIAKAHRDDLMVAASKEYPLYGFSSHKGYGSDLHRAAITEHGPCPLHRLSFCSSCLPDGKSAHTKRSIR